MGLTHFHCMIILCLAFLLFGMYFMGSQFGLFGHVEFQNETLPKMNVLYTNHLGEYHALGPAFEKIGNDCDEFFKISKMFAIYYDNPK